MKRYQYIDALRGLAFLMVLVVHVYDKALDYKAQLGTVPDWAGNLFPHGDKGVQLFFVVSAVTLFLSLEQRVGRERQLFKGFFLRRFFRIAPMYYLMLAVWLIYAGMGPRRYAPQGISLAHIASIVTFTNGWNPYWISSVIAGGWSVAVEMTFYLLVPLLFLKVKNLRGAVWLVLGSIVMCLASSAVLSHWRPIPEAYIWDLAFSNFVFPNQAPVFACGIACYFILERVEKQLTNEHEARKWGSPLVLGSLMLAALATREGNAWLTWHLPLHVIFAGIFTILVVGLSLWPMPLLVNPVTRFIGKVSYSAYLTHFLVLEGTAALVLGHGGTMTAMKFMALVLTITLAGTLLVSTATYYLVEGPGQALGKKIIKRIQVPVPVMVTAGGI